MKTRNRFLLGALLLAWLPVVLTCLGQGPGSGTTTVSTAALRNWKLECRVATTANVTIATALNVGDSIDSVTLVAGDRVLVKDQSTGAQNGIYIAGATPARATDSDTWIELRGSSVPVVAGSTATNKVVWRNTSAETGTVGTTAVTYAASSGDATAASAFGTDNLILRSDGTGKGVQSSGWILDDNSQGLATVTGSNTGFQITASGTNGRGFTGISTGAGIGVFGTNTGVAGIGVRGFSSVATGIGLVAEGGAATAIPFKIVNESEDLTFNLASNVVTVASSTGVNLITQGAIGLTAGPIEGTTLNTGNGAVELAAGTYTPTRSAEANTDANVTMTEAQYMQIGATVTVSGRFTADPTTTTVATSFEMTLPVASDIGAVEDVAGTSVCGNILSMCAEVVGVTANNTAKIQWKASDVTSQTWSYSFTYQVLTP